MQDFPGRERNSRKKIRGIQQGDMEQVRHSVLWRGNEIGGRMWININELI